MKIKKIVFLALILTVVFTIIYLNKLIIVGRVIELNDIDNNVIEANSHTSEFADYSPDILIVPIKAHIIADDSGYYTSFRDKNNILQTVNEVNRIWSQADIYFQVEEIATTEVSFNAVPNAINGNYAELANHENFDETKINVFFTQSLNNINGLALMPIKSVLVADFTTVNDYRATAHELGHLLGLKHIEIESMLMARGKNGENLADWEIRIARENAIAIAPKVS